jgi:hypothetical protein
MRPLALLTLICFGLLGCRALVGPETNDNPRVTPTSRTGVTSERGTNVYANQPATTTAH